MRYTKYGWPVDEKGKRIDNEDLNPDEPAYFRCHTKGCPYPVVVRAMDEEFPLVTSCGKCIVIPPSHSP